MRWVLDLALLALFAAVWAGQGPAMALGLAVFCAGVMLWTRHWLRRRRR